VIALARVNSCAVLTNEKPSVTLAKPRIPDVCQAYGIRTLNLLELIREKRWIFRG
jgi:hypothetical protein